MVFLQIYYQNKQNTSALKISKIKNTASKVGTNNFFNKVFLDKRFGFFLRFRSGHGNIFLAHIEKGDQPNIL